MNKDEELKSHITDLAGRCYQGNVYTFSGFLSLAEQSQIHSFESEISYVPFEFFGGMEGCERAMLRFGSPEMLGYDEAFPISTIIIKPLISKFSDKLTHRDYLGTIMGLGIERSLIGDICVRGDTGYVFAENRMAEFIAGNISRIKHTSVSCTVSSECPESAKPEFESKQIIISSARIDAIIAAVYGLSRNKSADIIKSGSVFIDGRECMSQGTAIKDGSRISVRGFGKFIFDQVSAQTGKGRLRALVRVYV